ncbi:MAG: hypothetical protein KF762_12520 [Acidobacteria bacterium]|nr:hypothetical protein [Acidobacteriota bacterium]
MKVNAFFKLSCIVFCVVFCCGLAQAQTTAFTYQGKLTDMSLAANGQYDLMFRLFDTAEGGGQIDGAAACNGVASGSPDAVCDDVSVSGGIFTVNLSFGEAAFINGEQRFLEIHVRPGASTDEYTRLSPRQEINSSPFSMKSLRAAAADSLSTSCVLCVTDAKIQSIDASKLTGILPITNGGTGSSTKNFVDLFSNQSVFGNKTFNNGVTFNSGVTLNQTLTINGSLDVPNGIVSADQFHGNGDGLFNVPGTFKWQAVTGLSQQAQPNNGYLPTNDAQVTITLPKNLGIGEMVRVSGAGSGGWKIAQNDGQSIILGSGIKVTLPPLVWTPRAVARNWQSVASSADGTKLVAVPRNGQIYTSSDSGVRWTPRDVNRNWRSVASSADGNKLVAVVESGQIYTSTDSGETWLPRDTNRFWTSVASSADGTKLAATGDGLVYTSNNSGLSWMPHSIQNSLNIGLIVSSSDGTKLVAADNGYSTGKIYTSDNSGVGWQQRAHGGFWQSLTTSADGTKLFAGIDPGPLFVSHDSGVTWNASGYLRNWYSIASSADGTRVLAADYGFGLYFSMDSGLTWIAVSQDPRSWLSVAISADGSKLVAAAQSGLIYTAQIPAHYGRATSVGTAGYLVGGQFTSVELQYMGNGQFMALSAVGPLSGN